MGFGSVTSEYKTLYLDQECCATGSAAIRTGDKIRQCYYTDVANGVTAANKKLMYARPGAHSRCAQRMGPERLL